MNDHLVSDTRPLISLAQPDRYFPSTAYDGDEVGTAKDYHRLLTFLIYGEAIPQLFDVVQASVPTSSPS